MKAIGTHGIMPAVSASRLSSMTSLSCLLILRLPQVLFMALYRFWYNNRAVRWLTTVKEGVVRRGNTYRVYGVSETEGCVVIGELDDGMKEERRVLTKEEGKRRSATMHEGSCGCK